MPDRTQWDEAKDVFYAALDVEPGARHAYLREACRLKPELLSEVESLLAWLDESDEFLETPLVRVGDLPLTGVESDVFIGQSLGPWRIVDVIGQGGMGAVYRAERADAAYRRPVAIKVIRRGANAVDIVERFRRERDTLAALDHPNIARLIDGGTTPNGQPYFVMEYVDGVRVDTYCDEKRLSIRARLEIFRTICAAVQYAHQTLVVHRDIKPDNILVSRDGVPKLLDFGIARLIAKDSGFADDVETAATWLMTPDYASPEQIDGRAVTISTDVYSLGVLLHVLLTGFRPYRLTADTQAALREQLMATTLKPPSERLLADTDEARAFAALRATTPDRLARRIGGDLDAIVCRALDRNPQSRYPTVAHLVDDLNRHRLHLPVGARGDDLAYQAGRFVRRHGTAFFVAGSIVLLAAVGVAGISWQAAIASEAQARAERRFEDVRRLAHVFMFDVHDEIVNVPGTLRARALMVRTATEYLAGLAREADSDLGLQRDLASAYIRLGDAQGRPNFASIGDTAGARASYERAIELAATVLRATPGEVQAERTRALGHRRMADVLALSGDLAAALTHCELSGRLFSAVAARRDATRDDQFESAIGDIKLGDLLGNANFPNLGRPAEATARYDQALIALRDLDAIAPGDQRIRRYLGIIFERIGTMHESGGRWSDAAVAYQESFDIRQALAASTPLHRDIQRDFAVAYEKLGNVQMATKDVEGALVSYRGALAQFERLAKADPSSTNAARSVAISREKVARAVGQLGQRTEQIELLRAALRTHQDLAARDEGNAQAPCDAARLAEVLGDTWIAGLAAEAVSSSPGCSYWRESLQARKKLQVTGVACATTADISRVASKLGRCQ